mmetsp:Transcript_50501/g.134291  ORF Transcript_50501/g.134291 Transcript_50501/m.134291 type:complete len:119 (+) Transcript_50501:765-1121(+)
MTQTSSQISCDRVTALFWLAARFQVPGGQIQQSISPFQQKVMFQYFHNGPSRWYYRSSKWTWPIAVPCLITYIIVNKSCDGDVQADIRKSLVVGLFACASDALERFPLSAKEMHRRTE